MSRPPESPRGRLAARERLRTRWLTQVRKTAKISPSGFIKFARAVDIGVLQNEHDRAHEEEDGPLPLDPRAHNKIPIYWIVSIERRTVEVFSDPVGRGDLATYAGTPLTFHEGEAVPVELDGSVIGHLDVKEIFA
jgi:hypothetical protein